MAELADALVLGTSGRPCRFESCYPHGICIPRKTVVFRGILLLPLLFYMVSWYDKVRKKISGRCVYGDSHMDHYFCHYHCIGSP